MCERLFTVLFIAIASIFHRLLPLGITVLFSIVIYFYSIRSRRSLLLQLFSWLLHTALLSSFPSVSPSTGRLASTHPELVSPFFGAIRVTALCRLSLLFVLCRLLVQVTGVLLTLFTRSLCVLINTVILNVFILRFFCEIGGGG